MKTFLVTWTHNYGTEIRVINSNSEEGARKYAEADGAWKGYSIVEISTIKPGTAYAELIK